MSSKNESEIQEIMGKLDVSHAEAHEIFWIMYDADQGTKSDLIVAETSTIADRWDKNKSVHLKRPKGQIGMTAPVICGFCGSIRKQEVKK